MKLLLMLTLIISVTGYGEIPEAGMDISVTEAVLDPLTDLPLMSLEGSLVTSSPLTVTITRSQAGLHDEFCCAGQCTAGNGGTSETLNFMPDGIASWFAHYTPASGSDVQINYLFSDGGDSRELRVHYTYSAEGVEAVTSKPSPAARKTLRDGRVLIDLNGATYDLQGAEIK